VEITAGRDQCAPERGHRGDQLAGLVAGEQSDQLGDLANVDFRFLAGHLAIGAARASEQAVFLVIIVAIIRLTVKPIRRDNRVGLLDQLLVVIPLLLRVVSNQMMWLCRSQKNQMWFGSPATQPSVRWQ